MALATNAMTELSVVLDELGLTSDGGSQDARLERYITVASDLFEQLTGTKWHRQSGHVERVEGFGTPVLYLSDYLPIDSVSSVVFDDGDSTSTVDADDYEVTRPELGELRYIGGGWLDTTVYRQDVSTERLPGTEEALYKVTYTGGYITPKQDTDGVGTRDLPHGLEQAIVDYVAMRWHQQGKDQTVSREKLGSWSASYVDGHRVPSSFKREVESRKLRAVA